MEQIIYIRKYIKTEDDLPKYDDLYYVHSKVSGTLTKFSFHENKDVWIKNIDWYLQPVTLTELIKEKLPEREIETIIRNYYDSDVIRFSNMVISDMIKGAKIIINKLTA